jgi:hypothetical protein
MDRTNTESAELAGDEPADAVDIGRLAEDDPQRYLLAVKPFCDITTMLADAAQGLAPSNGNVPGVTSIAMAHLGAQDSLGLRHEEMTDPIQGALSIAAVLALAAADHVRAFGRHYTAVPAIMYSHAVTARAAIETSVRCRWLAEPQLTPEVRVKRLLVALIQSARQADRAAPDAQERQKARARHATLVAIAAHHGWEVNPRRKDEAIVSNEHFPNPAEETNRVLNIAGSRTGAVLRNFHSAIAHGEIYAIFQSLEPHYRSSPTGIDLAQPFVSSDSVKIHGLTTMMVFIDAIDALCALNEWTSHDWRGARQSAFELRDVVARTWLDGRGS